MSLVSADHTQMPEHQESPSNEIIQLIYQLININKNRVSTVTLKRAAILIGLSERTLRDHANSGKYPSYVMKKVKGSWMVDLEEWDRWHRIQ